MTSRSALKDECRLCDLSIRGTKSDLLNRLKRHYSQKTALESSYYKHIPSLSTLLNSVLIVISVVIWILVLYFCRLHGYDTLLSQKVYSIHYMLYVCWYDLVYSVYEFNIWCLTFTYYMAQSLIYYIYTLFCWCYSWVLLVILDYILTASFALTVGIILIILFVYYQYDVWCWEDEYRRWRPYPYSISTQLFYACCGESIEYTVKSRRYIITKQSRSRGQQRNTVTNYIRKVKRTNDIYNCLDELRDILYIKPTWNNIKGYFHPSGGYPFVYNKFFESVSNDRWSILWILDITKNKFEQNYSKLFKPGQYREFLWHGTSRKNVFGGILCNNYDINMNVRHKYGKGTYFARNADYSKAFSIDNDNKYMLLNKVYIGRSTIKYSNEYNANQYDSIVDNIDNPQIYSIPNNQHIVPKYLVKFRRRGGTKLNVMFGLIIIIICVLTMIWYYCLCTEILQIMSFGYIGVRESPKIISDACIAWNISCVTSGSLSSECCVDSDGMEWLYSITNDKWDIFDVDEDEMNISTKQIGDTLVEWLLDADINDKCENRNVYVNKYQRVPNESVWRTVPQPEWVFSGNNGGYGYLSLFEAQPQWRYIGAPNANAL